MSDFLTWDQEISEEGKESKGAVVHKAGEYNFKVEKFEKTNVDNPSSAYHKAYMAKLELNVEGAKVFENLILHKNLDWKIGSFFRSLGLMQFQPAERWGKLLGSTGKAKVKVDTYKKDGEDREKNVIDFFLDKVVSFDAPSSDKSDGASSEEKLPWES